MHANMVKYDLLEDIKKLTDEWRSALEENGEQCVMMDGIPMMPKLYAGSSDTYSTSVHVRSVLLPCSIQQSYSYL